MQAEPGRKETRMRSIPENTNHVKRIIVATPISVTEAKLNISLNRYDSDAVINAAADAMLPEFDPHRIMLAELAEDDEFESEWKEQSEFDANIDDSFDGIFA